ncbi:MAG: nitronate monooxygenase family protein [bacterium]
MSYNIKPLIIGDLEIKIPIIQGGMGVKVSTASLASAVANCGGAGTIASVGLGQGTEDNESDYIDVSKEGLSNEIREAKRLTKGVIGVNILVALSNYEDLVRTSMEEKADFIIAGAGLPLSLPGLTKGSKIKLIPIVSSARTAELIIKSWKRRYDRFPDAIVVEGPLAGGHLGFGLKDLTPPKENMLEEIVVDVLKIANKYKRESSVNIPVIAAGGIYDGKDIVKFFKLGIQGVQIATRFVTTYECSVADEFKQLYISAKKDDIIIIDSPVGMPGKVIRTKFVDRINNGEKIPFSCNYQCLKTCNPSSAPYCIAKALLNAYKGDVDNAVVFAGSNVYKVDKIVHAKELIDSLISEIKEEMHENAMTVK